MYTIKSTIKYKYYCTYALSIEQYSIINILWFSFFRVPANSSMCTKTDRFIYIYIYIYIYVCIYIYIIFFNVTFLITDQILLLPPVKRSVLGSQDTSAKSQNFIGLQLSAQSSFQSKNIAKTSKKNAENQKLKFFPQ